MTVRKTFDSNRVIPLSYRSSNFVNFAVWVFVACLSACPSRVTAQPSDDQTATGVTPAVSVPAPLSGTIPRLRPTSEGEARNVIGGGLTIGALCDNFATDGNGLDDHAYQYSVFPSLTFQQTRPRTAWSADYRGGLTINRGGLPENPSVQSATSAAVEVQHAFGRRLLLDLRDDYVLTNDPFGHIGPSQSMATLSGTGQLNSYTATPAATRSTSISSGSLTDQLTRHSSMGISGSYSTQRFRDLATATPGGTQSLIDTRTTTGRGFYALEISRRQKIGLEYQLQDLRFGGDLARTTDQTLFLFDEISLATHVALTLFAGPDRAHTHNNIFLQASNTLISVVPLVNDVWAPAGGAMFTWRGKHAALSLSGQQVVTDGGGSTGAVRASSAGAELRKNFTSRWNLTLGYSYSVGRLLENLPTSNSGITVQQGSLVLERQLAKHLLARAQYARTDQTSSGLRAPLTTGNHNRVGVDLVYQFTRPFGQ